MKKNLMVAGIAALILLVVGILTAVLFLNSLVKKGVETVGPKILEVPVTLTEVRIGLITGSARVKGLVIGNPPGYQTPHAIRVGLAEVGVNPLSILADKIVIRSVRVEAPEITFEGNPLSKNNLGDIMDAVNAMARSGGPAATNAASRAKSKPAQKIQVDDFLITGAKVHVSLTGMGGEPLSLTLPDIHLTNLGKSGDGLTPTDLTRAVMSAITSSTIKAVASAATDIGRGLGNLGKEGGKALGSGMEKVTKGLGGLFGK